MLDILALVLEILNTLFDNFSHSLPIDLNTLIHCVVVVHIYLLFRLLDLIKGALDALKITDRDLKNASTKAEGGSATEQKLDLVSYSLPLSHVHSSMPAQANDLPSFLYDE